MQKYTTDSIIRQLTFWTKSKKADAFVIVFSEYNHGFSRKLKSLLDTEEAFTQTGEPTDPKSPERVTKALDQLISLTTILQDCEWYKEGINAKSAATGFPGTALML